jgi:hypothetical protein
MLQYVKAEDEEVHCTFCCDIHKLFTAKIVSVIKPPSICLGMLTDITLGSEEAVIHRQ